MLSLALLRGLPATSRVRVCDTCTVYENDTAGRVERVFQQFHVDYFLGPQLTIEVGTLDVKSVKLKIELGGNGENSLDGDEFGNWSVHVKVINAGDLTKSLCN